MSRRQDLGRLYELFDELKEQVGEVQRRDDCTGYMDWPDRGVYFFFAADETRDTTDKPRLTRVGTHAVSSGSGTSLWNRLRTHRGANSGTYEGGGNHRGSVFRKRVGEAMIEQYDLHDEYPHWGEGSSAGRDRRLNELELERQVSDYIGDLPFLWVRVDDEPSSESDRKYIERNAIALASNYRKEPIDQRCEDWLGNDSQSQKISKSELWCIEHVDEQCDHTFLNQLAEAVQETSPP